MEYPPEGMRHTTDNTEIVMYVTDRQTGRHTGTEEGYLQGQNRVNESPLKYIWQMGNLSAQGCDKMFDRRVIYTE